MATLRAALTYAQRKNRIPFNPAKGLGIGQTAHRIRVGTIAEMEQLIDAAYAIGRPEGALMALLALFTGQRQGDRVKLEGGHLAEGRLVFRQGKGGSIVHIPPAPPLVAAIAAARGRGAGGTVQWPQVVVDELRNRPWTVDSWPKLFREIRAAAVAGVPAEFPSNDPWKVPPCPSLADFTDQDFRDTAVTWLANAGCTIPEITAITGHSEKSVYDILRHYLGRDPERADAAIGKLVTWLEKKGARL